MILSIIAKLRETRSEKGMRPVQTAQRAKGRLPQWFKSRREAARVLYEKKIRPNWPLYLMLLPAVIYTIVFCYVPMYGIQIAFKNFDPALGILDSPWVGLKHFIRFFNLPSFWRLIGNTLGLSLYQLAVGFPLPILLALLLNYAFSGWFKKLVQTVTYASHFVSVVVLVGMMSILLSPRTGIVNVIITGLGGEPINFLQEPAMFKSLYVWSGVWQNLGWGSIIYIAALGGVNLELYEAASMDGATKLQRMRYIDLPALLPAAVTMLILNIGKIMSLGFEKAFLMQNPLNESTSEIIATYVYKTGLVNYQYSFSTAVGLFNNLINITLLLVVNHLAKRMADVSL